MRWQLVACLPNLTSHFATKLKFFNGGTTTPKILVLAQINLRHKIQLYGVSEKWF
ncbi:hypothetical protein ACE6H2_001844 [Prunus campanulata]